MSSVAAEVVSKPPAASDGAQQFGGDDNEPHRQQQEQQQTERRGSEAISDTESYETNKDYDDNDNENDNGTETENDDDPNNQSDSLMFEKQDVQKARTQSFQSVLSTASLKSLKQQHLSSKQPRSNSIISTTSNYNNSKNFQSFIQAPVLSSISDFKSNDEIEIGQRLPFDDKNDSGSGSNGGGANNESTKAHNDRLTDDDEDQDIIWQQQRLTMNALKKLSLSPIPIRNSDLDDDQQHQQQQQQQQQSQPKHQLSQSQTRSSSSRKSSVAKAPALDKISEPYKPAEVDLSTFASLTRQPKFEKPSEKSTAPQVSKSPESTRGELESPVSPEKEAQSAFQSPKQTKQDNVGAAATGPILGSLSASDSANALNSTSSANVSASNSVSTSGQNSVSSSTVVSPTSPTRQSQTLSHAQSSGSLNPGTTNFSQSRQQSLSTPSLSAHTAAYHKELQEAHLRSMRPNGSTMNGTANGKIPAAVIPPQDMRFRRTLSSHMVGPKGNSINNGNGSAVEVKSPLVDGGNIHQQQQPQSRKQLQQIKGFRSPMYVPAVLRMTSDINKPVMIDIKEGINGGNQNDSGMDNAGSLNNGGENANGILTPSNETKISNHSNSNNDRHANTSNDDVANNFNKNINNNNINNTSSNTNGINHNGNESTTRSYGIDAVSAPHMNSVSKASPLRGIAESPIEGRRSHSSQASLSSIESNDSTINSMSPRMSGLGGSGGSKNKLLHYEDVSRSAPTRRHWLKDESVIKCGIQNCNKYFSFFERRHHCRKCGGIYCNEHTSHYLYINHLAQFTTGGRGTLSKVCDYCIEEYNDFIKSEFGVDIASHKGARKVRSALPLSPKKNSGSARSSAMHRQVSEGQHGDRHTKGPVADKLGQLPTQQPAGSILPGRKEGNRVEQLVGSVPANWSWSSF